MWFPSLPARITRRASWKKSRVCQCSLVNVANAGTSLPERKDAGDCSEGPGLLVRVYNSTPPGYLLGRSYKNIL